MSTVRRAPKFLQLGTGEYSIELHHCTEVLPSKLVIKAGRVLKCVEDGVALRASKDLPRELVRGQLLGAMVSKAVNLQVSTT
jgi:hypothetical protein